MPLYEGIFSAPAPCYSSVSARLFIVLLERFSICFVALIILAFFHQIVLTHKLCGPLVNFSNTFKRISKGDLTRKVFLRRHDFLKTEARQINEMIDNLTVPLSTAIQSNRLMVAMLEEKNTTGATPNELCKMLRLLKKEADVCMANLENFTLNDDLGIKKRRTAINKMTEATGLEESLSDQEFTERLCRR